MSKKKTRKKDSKAFKLDVIQQSYQRENIREPASYLGLRPALIYKWRAVYQDNESHAFPGKGNKALSPEEEERHRLKAENAELRMERDILKKAIGIFGKTNGSFFNL